jgi:hypothetical protein
LGDAVPEKRIDFTTGKSEQTSQGPISGLLPPLAEQMEDEEQWRPFGPCFRVEGKEGFDLLDEQRNHLGLLGGCRLQRLFRKALGIGQFVEDFPDIHRGRLRGNPYRRRIR